MFSQIKTSLHHVINIKSEEEWIALEKLIEFKTYRKGECVLRAGEVAEYVYFLNKGLFRLFYEFKEKVHTSKFFKENEFVASYESFLTRAPSDHSLDALEDSEVLAINYDNLQQLYNNYPVYDRLGRLMAEGLFISVCEKNRKYFQSPEEKYLDFVRHSPDLLQRIPQYIIASYMAISPETLSRVRKRMSKKQLDLNQENKPAIAS